MSKQNRAESTANRIETAENCTPKLPPPPTSQNLSGMTAANLAEVNRRMKMLDRADDFALPWCDGCYVGGHSRVQAKEHRMMMQIFAHFLWGIHDEAAEVALR
jgi:hypothetical protein